jgi:hypothetical protein
MRPALTVLLLLLAAGPALAAFDRTPRNELMVGSSQRAVAAAAGGGCHAYPAGAQPASYPAECDYGSPLELGPSLFVRPGHLMALDFDAPVIRLHLRIVGGAVASPDGAGVGQPDNRVAVEPEGGVAPAKRWLARVPDHWRRAFTRLSAHAYYGTEPDRAEWDLNYEVGVQVVPGGTGRVKMPSLVGLPLAKALRELERRGLGWRLDGRREIAFDTGPPPHPDTPVARDRRRIAAQDLRPGRRLRRTTVVDLVTRR